jgi:hypothetical protein
VGGITHVKLGGGPLPPGSSILRQVIVLSGAGKITPAGLAS